MKKTLFMFLLVLSPSLCFCMREPKSSSTSMVLDRRHPDFGPFLDGAFDDKNIPLILLAADTKPLAEKILCRATASNIFDPKMFEALADVLPCNFRKTLLVAIQCKSYKAAIFLLEKYTEKFHQKDFDFFLDTVLNDPLLNFGNEQNHDCFILIQLLKKNGATISPTTASKGLYNLSTPDDRPISLLPEKNLCMHLIQYPCTFMDRLTKILESCKILDEGCNKERRNIAHYFVSQGGTFDTDCEKDCKTAILLPYTQIDLHREGKPFTVGSAVGFAVGCLLCCPCNALVAAKNMNHKEPISLASIMLPSRAVPMEYDIEAAPLTRVKPFATLTL